MTLSRAVLAGVSSALVVTLFLSQPVFAASQGGTTQWTLTAPMTQVTIGSFSEISATYMQHYNSTTPLLGIGLAVLRNAQGQAVFIATGTAQLAYDQQGSLYITITGAPAGSYTATVFVIDTAGVAVSNASTLAVTI